MLMCANKYPHVPPVELLANINNDIHHFFMNRAERMSRRQAGYCHPHALAYFNLVTTLIFSEYI